MRLIQLQHTYLFCSFSFSQTFTTASVVDLETNISLPFVNIGIKGTYIGTTTNLNGEFNINLPADPKYRTLVFSCIGYENKEYIVKEGETNMLIKLKPHTYDISEVTIMPDSTLRSFLRKAFDKISENYSSVPTKYKGFYRASIQNSNDDYLRFMEALTEVYKSSYKNKEEGTVKILKSRKYLAPNHQSEFPTHFYGGVHACHLIDFVKNRSGFLSGSTKYQYTLVEFLHYNNKDIYKISFKPIRTDGEKNNGFIYIDANSLAFVKIEVNKTKKGLETRSKNLTPLIPNDIKSIEK
jgi:hypothetical protein